VSTPTPPRPGIEHPDAGGDTLVQSCECGANWAIDCTPDDMTIEQCWMCSDRFVAHPPLDEKWSSPEIVGVRYVPDDE